MSCPTYYLGKLYVIYIIALLFDYILLCKLSKTILNVFYMINKNSINLSIIFIKILYLILDYPHKHYTFKHFEV